MSAGELLLPLACTGHVLVDLPIFFGPVFLLTGWIFIVRRRDRKRTKQLRPSL
ncbi:MAG TPA: hypothetical protein VGF74_07365 [Thermoleophilaceae bacterium]|jgi:hypothetical protein